MQMRRKSGPIQKQKKVRYWIDYPLPNGKVRLESVGAFEGLNAYSITDAKAALAKRTVQRREKRILEMLPESTMTFQELTDWDLELKTVKKLKSYVRVKQALNNFNAVFDNMTIDEYVKLVDKSPQHLKAFVVVAFNTGMRVGELRLLKWSYVDRVNDYIRLPAEVTKEDRQKNIPINHHVKKALASLPRAIQHDFVFSHTKGNPLQAPEV